MSTTTIMNILFVLLAATVIVPFGAFYLGGRKASRLKRTLAFNITGFFGVLLFATAFMFMSTGNAVYAAEAATVAASAGAESGLGGVTGMAYLSAALVTGMATIGTGIGIGQAAAAALGALSENDKIMGKALIFVALAEGTAIYGLLISFTILGRV